MNVGTGIVGAISYETGVTCENTGAEDKCDTAKDAESIDPTKCHKGANGNVGEASSEDGKPKACLAVVSHDDKVIIPNNLFPRSLKGFDADKAHGEMFTTFAHVFDNLTGLDIEHDQKYTPESKAWKHIRVAGGKAFENCIAASFRNDSFLTSLMPGEKGPSCMRDIIDILNGLSKTEQFNHDPFLIVTITCKHIHSITSEDWVCALKAIFGQQPVPFSFVEAPDPTKKTKKHSIAHIASLGKHKLIKAVQRLEENLARMTFRSSRRKIDEKDCRKTQGWKTVELSVLNLPVNMGKTGVLAIEPYMFDSWMQKLAVQDGDGVRDLAKQSEAARLVFQLVNSAVRTSLPLENVMHLLTSAFREQRCLPDASAIAVVNTSHIPRDSGDSAAITFETQNQGNSLNNSVPVFHYPQGNGRDTHQVQYGTSAAITPETQNQGNLLNNINYPQGNSRDIRQVQGAHNLTALTQGTVTKRSGRHVPGSSVPHNFFAETPNLNGTHDFDSIGNVLFLDEYSASLDVNIPPLKHRERTVEATMATPLPTQTRPATAGSAAEGGHVPAAPSAAEGGHAPAVPVVPRLVVTPLPTQTGPIDHSNSKGTFMVTEIFVHTLHFVILLAFYGLKN